MTSQLLLLLFFLHVRARTSSFKWRHSHVAVQTTECHFRFSLKITTIVMTSSCFYVIKQSVTVPVDHRILNLTQQANPDLPPHNYSIIVLLKTTQPKQDFNHCTTSVVVGSPQALPLQLTVDLIAEAHNVLPIILPVERVGRLVYNNNTHTHTHTTVTTTNTANITHYQPLFRLIHNADAPHKSWIKIHKQ